MTSIPEEATEQVGKTIHVTIKTVEGDEDRFKFKETTLVGQAKQEAMDKFHIVPPAGVTYRLAEKKNGNFRPFDDNKTLAQEGVENKDTIWLGTEQQVG
jgi:hypothetical protein